MPTRRDFVTATSAACLTAALLPAGASRALAQTATTSTTTSESFELHPQFKPQVVKIKKQFQPGEILILPRSHFLYFVFETGKAIRYGVGVGKAGLEFTGQATIDVKKEWPTWRPTDEMIERDPRSYAKFNGTDYVMPGGPSNPLGARALYLFQNGKDTYFRIHGTTAPESIGRSVSNGCIRMLNEHVIDLYNRVPLGTVVTVL
ncbi:L,D-transpeptidase [Aliiruegeria sabulilitoris]|uniref:L,D-transpeptidase n=1 Tax=Aliiruegeria sabulilitoris TaxID=1510458 RepID=UPI000832CB03|nr:L,D-transpeptidase [Aliiruegeria sabulilitoris]NDR57237.1 L,D-transpeptidase [Pseudoruegeria sp. M32A2M]